MSCALLALTRGALAVAGRIRERYPDATLYTLPRWEHPGSEPITGSLPEFTGTLFRRHRVLVFIMAAGVAVRSIAPHLAGKETDPAVLVVDEGGRFVISLLSGHEGGANAAATELARTIGATPVITTASDVVGVPSVDMLAKQWGCVIGDRDAARTVTALLVNGGTVALESDWPLAVPALLDRDPACAQGLIRVSNRARGGDGRPLAQLIPRNVVAGVGCTTRVNGDALAAFIAAGMDDCGLDRRCIKCIASITLKEEDPAIAAAAAHFAVPLRFFAPDAIRAVEGRFAGSDFVREQVGVGAVAEPCAYLASNGTGWMILPKRRGAGMTLALWEEECREETPWG